MVTNTTNAINKYAKMMFDCGTGNLVSYRPEQIQATTSPAVPLNVSTVALTVITVIAPPTMQNGAAANGVANVIVQSVGVEPTSTDPMLSDDPAVSVGEVPQPDSAGDAAPGPAGRKKCPLPPADCACASAAAGASASASALKSARKRVRSMSRNPDLLP